jgi:signal peptidase I
MCNGGEIMNFVERNPNSRASAGAPRARSAERSPQQTSLQGYDGQGYDGQGYNGQGYNGHSSADDVHQRSHIIIRSRVENGQSEDDDAGPHSPGGLAVGFFLLREIVQVMLPALLLALVIHLFLAQATVVYGRSMEPSLFESQRLIIDKISYRVHPPQRNDIVVLNLPGMDEMLVKRIIGLPGEEVEVRDGKLYINGVLMKETFIAHTAHYDFPATTLGPLNYFVLGDNRDNSNDSRSFGSVQREHIVGRVWLRYWPLRQFAIF